MANHTSVLWENKYNAFKVVSSQLLPSATKGVKLKVRKLWYVQLIMNSGGHSYSKDIYKKKFEGRKRSLSMQIQGQVTSGNTKY